jgi:hypothetical protein
MDEHRTPYTYEQAGKALGIETEAVRARARRGALRRGPTTNDKRPTVLLSPADIATIRAGIRPARPEAGPEAAGRPDEKEQIIKALKAEAVALRERMERAEVRADLAQTELAAERARVTQAEREREQARVQAAAAEGELKGLITGANHLHEELARMRREVAESHNRAVTAEQMVLDAVRQREGAEQALARARKWNFLNFLLGREGKGRQS